MAVDLGLLQQSLVNAGDAQLARIVAMVDAMPNRGEADALIAPLRSRLALIRPARKMSFTRLLFSPLDTLIIPAREWRRGEVGVARSNLSPLAAALHAMLPELCQDIERALVAVVPGDRGALAALGGRLWPEAAAAFDVMPVPEGWADTAGMMFNDYPELIRTVAGALHEGAGIEQLVISRVPPADDAVGAVLSRSLARGPTAMTAVVAVLLARLPDPDRVLALAAHLSLDNQGAGSEQVVAHALKGLQASIQAAAEATALSPAQGALAATRAAVMLEALSEGAAKRPERRRIEAIRREADLQCREQFGKVMAAFDAGSARDDERAVAALEAGARDVRRLETAGRRLGSASFYDASLRTLVAAVSAPGNALAVADRARLVEILAGPEEALALLEACG